MHESHTSWWWAGVRGAGVPRLALLPLAMLAEAMLAEPVPAQSLLERPPTMPGGWVGTPGALQFNFLHRFTNADPPTRKVTSSPTFLVAVGLPGHALVGVNYATNSDVAPRYPNEWEAFARWAPLGQDRAGPLDVALQAGYNVAARSADGELALGRRAGPLTLRGAARVLSNAYYLDHARAALAGGAVVRLGRWLGIAGDYATMLDRPAGFDNVWSAGVQLAIPYSPHTLSLHVTNANTGTLQGVSATRAGAQRRYGFEFTVPLTLRRFVPRRTPPPLAVDADTGVSDVAPATSEVVRTMPPDTVPARGDSAPAVRDTVPGRDTIARRDSAAAATAPSSAATSRPAARTVRTDIRQNAYARPRIVVPVGSTILWTNRDPMIHTVTSDDRGFDSGIIEPGGTYRRRFDRPGTYTFHCTPHPFMKGVVVVR